MLGQNIFEATGVQFKNIKAGATALKHIEGTNNFIGVVYSEKDDMTFIYLKQGNLIVHESKGKNPLTK